MIQVGQVLCEIATESEDGAPEQPEFSAEAPLEGSEDTGGDVMPLISSLAAHGPHAIDGRAVMESQMRAEGGHRTVGVDVKRSQDAEKGIKADEDLEEADTHVAFQVDESSEYAGGAKFTGEASILPSAPEPTISSSSTQPVVPRRETTATNERKISLSSPAVRALARRLDVDLEDVHGSGEKGRIRKEDVEASAAAQSGISASGRLSGITSRTMLSLSAAERSKEPELNRVEFGRTRKVMWKALGAQGSVPHFG